MPDKDELLHLYLKALENGASLENILARLPAEASDLAPLIRLAAAVRTLAHPEPLSETARAREGALLAAARQGSPPPSRPSSNGHRRMEWGSLRWALAPVLAGVTLLFVFAVVSLFGIGVWLSTPQTAQSATLMEVDGQVEVASSDLSGVWKTAANGEQVRAGQRLRTHADSSATLVFFDGSRTALGPNTDLRLGKVEGGWGKVIQVVLNQTAGKTTHSVVPFRSKNSSFVVLTPSGTASVHGTVFSVAVDSTGRARFSVASGEVLVENDSSRVSLVAGQATAAGQDETLDQPTYEFTLQGALTAKGATTWAVLGIEFTVVPGETDIIGDPQVGEDVIVEGRILESGERVADSIAVAMDYGQYGSFTGILEVIGSQPDPDGRTQWVIGGKTVLVDEDTELSEGLEVGDAVRAVFKILKAGQWLASSIEALVEPPQPSPTPTDTPTATGTLTPTVTTTMTATVTSTETAEALVVTCTGANPHPKASQLAGEYDVTPDEIMGWFCQRFGFGEIDLAYGLSRAYNVPVEDIFALRSSGLGWGHIKKQVPAMAMAATATPTPPVEGAPANPSGEASATAQPPAASPPSEEAVVDCTGATKQNRSGLNLAASFGVDYLQIMDWYCQGFNFGDIHQAYSLSAATGKPVADIFEMRRSGMNWGEIKKALGGNPGNGNGGGNGNGNGNGNGHGKP